MAWHGFKTTYAPGAFDGTALLALFEQIRSTLITAGFSMKLDTPTLVEVIQAGATQQTDDTPHWAFELMGDASSAAIQVHSIFGVDFNDNDAVLRTFFVTYSDQAPAETLIWFAANGATGAWWLYAIDRPEGYPYNAGNRMKIFKVGATSRRYPSDQYQGLCARYGVLETDGEWNPAYALDEDGDLDDYASTDLWSPFGRCDDTCSQRHPGSPLPRMAVPAFPCKDEYITACLLGELNEFLILTDGYALEEEVVPGWMACVPESYDPWFALPVPLQFTVP